MQAVKLPTSLRNLLLAAHIAATVSVLGTDLVLVLFGIAGFRGADPLTVYPAAHLVGTWLTAPLAIISLTTGLLLGALTPWNPFRHGWVALKLTLTVILTAALLIVLVPRLGTAATAVAGSAPRMLTSAERVLLMVAPVVSSALLVVAIALAVFKPAWPLQRDTGSTNRVVAPLTNNRS